MGIPLKSRLDDEVFTSIRNRVEYTLPTYPCDNILRHYHADRGVELIDRRIKKFLLNEFETTVTWSSTDSPELNAVLETLGEMTLSLLADSGLPKSFWWDAYVTACNITRMLPTRTHKGWISPEECVPGGRTEDFARRLPKQRTGSHDDDASGVASTVAGEVRPAEPEASSGREIGPSDVSEHTT